MKVGIMQPYFFPYIGYFQLIANTDKWVFFDVVQYNKRSWMNRNRVLHPAQKDGYQYIGVPIKKHQKGTLIKDVMINEKINWKQEVFGKLTVYKRMKAEYYDDTVALLVSVFEYDPLTLLDLSVFSIKMICEYLDLDFRYEIASDIEFDRSLVEGPGDWALSITRELGGSTYVNPPGGVSLFDENKYRSYGIDLLFLKPRLSSYSQSRRDEFVPGLSIIDLLMFNAPERIRDMIMNDFNLCRKAQLIHEDVQ